MADPAHGAGEAGAGEAGAGRGASAPSDGPAEAEGRLGILAGTGALPRLIAEAELAARRPPFVVRFAGTEAPWAAAHDGAEAPFEKPGRLLAALRKAGCARICLAGALTRPRLNPLRFDRKLLSLAPRALALLRKGDDEMLRGFAALLEAEGLQLVAPQDLLGDLLARPGVLSARAPTEAERADAARAAAIVAALGAVDVGQGAVAAEGLCLGVEAIGGTDVLLGQVAALPDHVRPARPSGVLFKGPKPGQDRRMDLPAIGAETLRRVSAAGLSGLCLAADGALILGREEVAAEADRLGLALWAMTPGKDAG